MEAYNNFYGRLFTKYQLTAEERRVAQELSSTVETDRCFRCSMRFEQDCQLPNGAYYCRRCLQLGRIRSDEALYYFPQKPFPRTSCLQWRGQLTSWQQAVSDQLAKNIADKQATLVHAVTGAGKTEMVYQALASVIDNGGAICLASPRIDVCLELYHRLQKDFSVRISLLHGESEPYVRSPLVIATTHQLLKFYRAFDLVLVDEVDAFPYVDNPVLYQAVENAVKEEGVKVFLTATSTKALDRQVRAKQLACLRLPRRFHGHKLVVPEKKWCASFERKLERGRLVYGLRRAIACQRKTGFPLLLFLPEIEMGRKFADLLANLFPNERVGFVSSQTENRLELVASFRNSELTILVSTTILERGVTFPNVDVFVVEAHHRLYTSSSLIQIAGRAGRGKERPTGLVYFFHEGTTSAIEQAIKEIQMMNKEASDARVSPL